ncbi:trypsin-like peptidase domain-containing protein [Streptomyces sp. TRM 70351]|uniref:trypsin-like serine peptidase n=1 Tax=Streptomyces sp. TRM 70351 TaxID=3116552 RepID=UPI002E7B9A80|nr:trypsin-like peptidase domain-containing protein [Streptomyces sp. TRM 70351]MEE1929898.1 trypsin-like peptidase domain-containing protein [Streptomyces sp. TRM 70351]
MEHIRTATAALATTLTAVALAGATGPAQREDGGPGAQGGPWAGGSVTTVGKLVTDLGDGRTGVCSGAIVDSPSGSVIATAAHCLTSPDRPDRPRAAWFAPGYEAGPGAGSGALGAEGAMEHGWKVVSYHVPPGWDVNRPLEDILPHDYAFVTVEKKQGRSVQEEFGANRLDFAPVDPGSPVLPMGYPAAPPYDGLRLVHCSGRAELLTARTAHAANVGGLLLAPCRLTQGASGGPWLQDFDAASGSGTVVGVMSVGSGDGQVLGRPFPAATGRALYAEATAV